MQDYFDTYHKLATGIDKIIVVRVFYVLLNREITGRDNDMGLTQNVIVEGFG